MTGLPESVIRAVPGLHDGAAVVTEQIKSGVLRVRPPSGASVIVKRLDPAVAHRNRLVVTRWLPAVGLADAGPVLLATVPDPGGERIWHVYEDFGERSLEEGSVAAVEESVELIASLHMRFADHPLLGECRLHGGDLGPPFHRSNAVDALRALAVLAGNGVPAVHQPVLGSLRRALRRMLEDDGRIRTLLSDHGGPETLLHGDLWRKNVMLVGRDGAARPRLIDWDHAAVGHWSYDLSTLLLRFPKAERLSLLELYRRHVSAVGWELPGRGTLNELFALAERSRIANRVIWPAIQLHVDPDAGWALDQLAEVARWFDDLEAVLP